MKVAAELDDLRHVVVVFFVDATFGTRVEEVVACCELKDHAGDTPDVNGGAPVTSADNSFRGAILPRLDILGVMVISGGGIAQVGYLDTEGGEVDVASGSPRAVRS